MTEGSGLSVVNLIFLLATGAVAWHAIRFRGPDGEASVVHLLFGCIAAVFFLRVLFEDVLQVARF